MENNFGIVFAGGGGKGAWQLGVWKALSENNIRANAVSGTSVGALNAALYAQGSYDKAIDAWMSISNKKLLQPNFDALSSKAPEIAVKFLGPKLAAKIGRSLDPTKISLLLSKTFPGLGKTYGIFSQDGLVWLINNFLDFEKKNDFLPTFVTCHNKKKQSVEYFNLFPGSERDFETSKKILLASAAIPYVFDNIEIDGEIYSDGGFDIAYCLTDGAYHSEQYNNTPVEILANHSDQFGIQNIVLLALNRDELTTRPHYGALRVLPLLPSESLGGLTDGCLDFDPEHAQKRIAQGYRDAQKWLELSQDFINNENKLNEIWNRILNGEENYLRGNTKISAGGIESNEIDKEIQKFNQIVISDAGYEELDAAPNSISLEKMLQQGDLALIEAQKRDEIDHLVEILVEENKDNATLLTHYAMDAIAALAPVQSRGTELLEQGVLSRFWHGLTGKNMKMISTSIINLAQAQYASIRLIQKLQTSQLYQFEMTGALHARLNRLVSDVALVQENQNQKTREIYHSLALVYCKVRKQLLEQGKKIEKLEERMDLAEWLLFCPTNLDSLSSVSSKLLTAAMEFYFIAADNLDMRAMKYFQTLLRNTGLDKELISVNDLISECKKSNRMLASFREDFRIEKMDRIDSQDWIPAVFDKSSIEIPGGNVKMPTSLLASELFYLLQSHNWKPRKNVDSGVRASYIDRCEKLRKIVTENSTDLGKTILSSIDQLEDRIKKYYFRVYLVGPFSSGKSSLLNAWLQQDLLPSGIAPETAVASELMYSREERIVLYPIKSNMPLETLSGASSANLERVKKRANAGELLKVQIFLNNPKLQRYPDVCLVDMPGLSSGLAAHEEALNQFILERGNGIFCVPMHDGTIQDDGVKFLRKMNNFDCGFYLLMTKADEKPLSEHPSILQTCRNIIHNELGIPMEDLKSGIVSNRDSIGIDDFTSILNTLLDQKDQIFINKFEADLQNLCLDCIRPLKKLLSRDFSSHELEEEMEKISAMKQQLPQFLLQLSQGVDHKIPMQTNNVVERIKSTLFSLKPGLKAQIKAKQDCSGEITSNMKSIMLFEIQNRAHAIFSQAVADAAKYFGEKLSYSISAGEVVADNIDGLEPGNHMGTGILLGGLGGAGLGALIGSVIPGIGTAVGAVVGALFGGGGGGWLGHKINDDSELECQLHECLENAAEKTRPIVQKAFTDSATKFKDDLKDAMEKKLEHLEEQNLVLKNKLDENQAEFDSLKAQRETVLSQLQQTAGLSEVIS